MVEFRKVDERENVIGEVNEEEEFFIEWTISDFCSLPAKVDKYYLSPSFSFNGARWRLVMFPNGEKEKKSEGYVGLYLYRESPGPPIELNCSIGRKTPKNRMAQKRENTYNFENQIGAGWCDFLQRSILLEWLKRAPPYPLTWVCRLKHPESSAALAAGNNNSSGAVVKSKIVEDLKQLLQTQENSDVVIRVKGREFPAHKAILTARSSVFASTFRNDMKEKATGIIDIEDCDPSTFSDFLCFLYSEDVERLSKENIFSLFTAADKYDVSDLREKCIEFMKHNLTIDTFCDTLTLALRHSETELTRLATNFFVANVDKIIVTVSWQKFAAENPTQSNELFVKFVASVKH